MPDAERMDRLNRYENEIKYLYVKINELRRWRKEILYTVSRGSFRCPKSAKWIQVYIESSNPME